MGAPGMVDAPSESFIHIKISYYRESNARRNRLASSCKIMMDISTSVSHNAVRKAQRVRTRHCVGSDAMTEAAHKPSSSGAGSPKKSVVKRNEVTARLRQRRGRRDSQACWSCKEITDSMTITICESARVNLVEDSFLPPFQLGHLIFYIVRRSRSDSEVEQLITSYTQPHDITHCTFNLCRKNAFDRLRH